MKSEHCVKIKSASRQQSTLRRVAICSLTVLSFAACAARRTTTTETRSSLKTWTDTATLIHVSRAELVQLETLRIHLADTTLTVTRSSHTKSVYADTTAAASTALRSDSAAKKTQTDLQTPLTAQSKKKGQTPLCATWLMVVAVIFGIFFVKYHFFKNK